MTINGISHLDPIQPGKKPGRAEYVRGNDQADSINFSSEAKERAEVYQVMELIKSAPDMDDSQIEGIRERINNPTYLTETVLNATADKLMNAFGI